MATENQSELSFSLDRRQLLTTAAAAVTVAGIVPTRPTEIVAPAAAASGTDTAIASSGAERLCGNGSAD